MSQFPKDAGWCGDRSRGAGMGRPDTRGINNPVGKVRCFRVRPCDSGGDYDDGGAYWGGLGANPLYCFQADGDNGEEFQTFERFSSRSEALAWFESTCERPAGNLIVAGREV